MALRWTREQSPRWDAHKRAVFGTGGAGAFGLATVRDGDVLAGEWWRVDDGDETVGYGRLDSVWGDAEILVAVAPGSRGTGVGTFVLGRLEGWEAGRRGGAPGTELPVQHRPAVPAGTASGRRVAARARFLRSGRRGAAQTGRRGRPPR